jgi:hypothetical protein
MSKWLVDSIYQTQPTKVELLSESACFATVKLPNMREPIRIKKEDQLFDTFDDAKQFMVDGLEEERHKAKRDLDRIQDKLLLLTAMEEPHD